MIAILAVALATTVTLAIPLWMMRQPPPPPFTGLVALRHLLTLTACTLLCALGLHDPLSHQLSRLALHALLPLALLTVIVLSFRPKGDRT